MNPSSGTGDGITKFPAQSSASLFGNLSATIGVGENRHCDLHWPSPAACAFIFRVWFCCCLAAHTIKPILQQTRTIFTKILSSSSIARLDHMIFLSYSRNQKRFEDNDTGMRTPELYCKRMFTGRTPVKSRYRKHDLVSFGLLCIYPHADALIKRHESRCSKTRSEDNLVCLVRRPIR